MNAVLLFATTDNGRNCLRCASARPAQMGWPWQRSQNPRVMVSALVGLSFTITLVSVVVVPGHAAFPTAWGGCPSPPQALPLDAEGLPASISAALADAASAIEQSFVTQQSVGLSVGVVYNQSLLWSRGYGLKNASDPTSTPDANTIFRIGSISKIFATLQLLLLRDGGKLALDDEVVAHVPGFRSPQQPKAWRGQRGITFRQLATHLAGLPREVPCDSPASCAANSSTMWERIGQMSAILPTDTRAVYSNLGFAILGNALAEVAGAKSYSDMIDQNIIGPMGLNGTGVLMSTADRSRLAQPYTAAGEPCGESCLADFGWGDPCGSMYSTVADLSKIISLMFRDNIPAGSMGPSQILDGATLREMCGIRYLTRDHQAGFALTWELYRIGDYMIRTKRGDVDGYASEIIFVPELKLGIVVLANIVEHAQDAAQRMTNILLPAFEAVFRANAATPSLPSVAASLVGDYRVSPGQPVAFTVAVSAGGDRLILSGDGWDTVSLVYDEQASDAPNYRFRRMPPPGDANACQTLDIGDDFQLVNFEVPAGSGQVSMSMDITWGTVWTKTARRNAAEL